MRANMFMPKYMLSFKCIGSKCIDTCCAGWDINIDEDTYKKYINCTGELKDLVKDKFKENKNSNDYFNMHSVVIYTYPSKPKSGVDTLKIMRDITVNGVYYKNAKIELTIGHL